MVLQRPVTLTNVFTRCAGDNESGSPSEPEKVGLRDEVADYISETKPEVNANLNILEECQLLVCA